jgi:hypothetical protein
LSAAAPTGGTGGAGQTTPGTLADFAARVAAGTGLDPYTVLGWVKAEGGPLDNPLNLGPGTHYGSEAAAAAAVVHNLNTPLYASVEKAAHAHYANEQKKIDAEAHAIAYSPWNNPNDPGSASRSQYESNIKKDADAALFQGGIGKVPPVLPPDVGNIPGVSSVGDALGSIAKAAQFVFSVRFLEILGGGLVVLLGLYLLARRMGVSTPSIPVVSAAAG